MSEPIDNLEFLGDSQPTTPRRGFSLTAVLLLIVVVVFAALIGFGLMQRIQGRPSQGPAPDFSVTTFDGQQLKLSDLRGKVVVVNFWASWCIPCKEEAPALEAIWQEYRDRDVVILGVAYADTDLDSRAFIQKYNLTYPNAPDLGTQISYNYHITGVPETFVVDQRGQIAELYLMQVQTAQLSAVLDRLLGAS
jgi:cytochrome c biogenesis protein CcmG/thiol:disulfide interchange protein DsbE